MKVMGFQSQTGQLFVADFDFGFIMIRVQRGFDDQTTASRGAGDQIDDGLMTHQGAASPVLCDETEQTMLNLVPFARAGRKVTDQEFQFQFVSQVLQRCLPQPRTMAVAAAAIGRNLY
jgi:hypothetical protein